MDATTGVETAIKAIVDGDTSCKALGLVVYSERATKKTDYPYLSMCTPLDARTGRSSDSTYQMQQVQLQIYAQSKSSMSACAAAVRDALHDDADLSQYVVGGESIHDHQLGNGHYALVEDSIWQYTLLFNCRYSQHRRKPPL